MTPIFGEDVAVAAWVSERIGRPIEPPYTAIGFRDHNGGLAGVVFNDYVPGGNIEMTVASDVRFTRRMFKIIARYVFGQLGCCRLTVRTRKSNAAVCEMAERIGFVREATLKDFFGPGDHAELFRMLRRDCKRWLH